MKVVNCSFSFTGQEVIHTLFDLASDDCEHHNVLNVILTGQLHQFKQTHVHLLLVIVHVRVFHMVQAVVLAFTLKL